MLIKFETKSARVKGLSFHPKRRWLLASLHNGVIQLWDYSEKTMIDKFDEHKGPVRGLDFHPHQPLFVSGGDDSKIKVWNYKSRRCLFTIDAHEDYVRTTYFHHEHPWILSASDDQSIRIWNWQSRSRIAVLTGHSHYIMCAQFHPSSELIISASVDQTLRIWDVSGLTMKNKSSSVSSKDEITSGLPEILSKTDYTVVPYDAHSSEINWCDFHFDSSKTLALSAADDNLIKIWKLDSRNGLRELDTLRGHYNNVSCAIFVTMFNKDYIMSVSEDRSIRVWDVEKRVAVSTYRREVDRFWTVVGHPSENIFAAGHDTGLILYKLERERPAFTVVKDLIFFIRGKQLWKFNMKTDGMQAIANLKPRTELTHHYHRVHCYSFDDNKTNQILVSVRSTNVEKSIYDLYKISSNNYGDSLEPSRSPGLTAIFIGPNRYAVLDKSKNVVFKINDEERKPKVPIKADEIFEAGAGRIFLKSKIDGANTISLWDIEKGCAVSTLKVDAKFIVMNENKSYIACIGSNKITITDGHLKVLSTIQEQRKIKSAAWEESGALMYSTPVHVKYALTDGDTTTVLSVEKTLYIMAVRDSWIFCMTRNGDEIEQIRVDSREFKFKQAVIKNDRSAILNSLRQLGSLTRAEISFLVKKGHPGLALKFVKDLQTRFPLALQAYDIDDALEVATQLNDKRCWEKLAEAAMQVGHMKAAEKAFQELEKPNKLAMLYLVSDQRDKMIEARKLANKLGDTSTEFIVSLLLKDFAECTRIIRRCGHANLAYTCAVNHGLRDLALEIKDSQEVSEEQLERLPEIGEQKEAWMQSTIPDVGNSAFKNWPLLNDEQQNFTEVLEDEVDDPVEFEDNGDWKDDELKSSHDEKEERPEEMEDAQEDGWMDDEPLEDLLDDEDDDEDNEEEKISEEKTQFTAPSLGQSIASKWVQISDLALHHVLAGSYKTAISFLQSQIGLVNLDPFRAIFKDIALHSRVAYRGLALYPTMFLHPESLSSQCLIADDVGVPSGGYRIEDLEKRLTDCYALFSGGKFSEAIERFRNLLLSTVFLQIYITDTPLSVSDREKRAKEIISVCKEYILGLQIWLERKNVTGKNFEDHKRACELAAYFSRLNLPKHRSKVLEKAFEVFLLKPKEFQKTRAASSIAHKLLDYISSNDPKKEKLVAYAKKVKSSFDAQIDQEIQLAFDDLNPYSLCAATFTPIYSGNKLTSCPLCDAKYKPDQIGEVCKICLVSEIGRSCSGIRFKVTSFGDE